ALPHQDLLTDSGRRSGRRWWDWVAIRGCPAADASLRILADDGVLRVRIERKRRVVGLAPYIAYRKHEVSGDPAFDRQAPLLARGCEKDRIDTGGAVETASWL